MVSLEPFVMSLLLKFPLSPNNPYLLLYFFIIYDYFSFCMYDTFLLGFKQMTAVTVVLKYSTLNTLVIKHVNVQKISHRIKPPPSKYVYNAATMG